MPVLRFMAFGYPVVVLPSFLLVALIVMGFGLHFEQPLWMAVATTLVILVSTLVHELGHAVMATRLGVQVEFLHIHGLGGGVRHATTSPGRRLLIAVSGPLAGIGLTCVGIGLLLMANNPYAQHTMGALVVVSGLWSVLNLLPLVPLDGAVALQSALQLALPARRAVQATLAVGIVVGVGFTAVAGLVGEPVLAVLTGFFVYRNIQLLRRVL